MTNKLIQPGQTIGILGGGQLGRMMATAAKHMGYRIAVLDPKEDCPCAQVADHHIIGAYDDREAAQQLLDISDVITYEFENVDLSIAEMLEDAAKLPQGAYPLKVTQNRELEKGVSVEAGLNVPEYAIVQTFDQLKEAAATIGFPSMLKTVTGGYDGKGQLKLDAESDLAEAESFIAPDSTYIIEAFVPFDREISIIFTRSQSGDIVYFPIAENIHHNQILFKTQIPAAITADIEAKAQQIAKSIGESMDLAGTFAIELFVQGDQVFVNEMAPRPHNSGHYTIEACNVSQFEQHIRALVGLPLLPVHTFPAAVMINVLGAQQKELFRRLEHIEQAHLHDYGKKEARANRKMGHITFIGESLEQIEQTIEKNNLHSW
ncbi:5-(carboxyamino)imidazole ribonucleotide synthase [Thalassobacillus hwangdonensis]|uniref:N5-carboxyaminoimidazole ribonucleotide synthase n=1 Tax=Thalassobacillus hwangdonensis TaxID=546108 RepID=A0ABW3L6D1_9BACI